MYVRNFEMCVCNFEMCVCNFEKREMKYELHFQFWIMFLTLCSVIDFVCVVTPVGHRMWATVIYEGLSIYRLFKNTRTVSLGRNHGFV